MQILIMNPFFHPYYGGTEKHILEVGKRLAKKHRITVLTAKLDGTAEREELFGVDVVREPADVYYSAPHPIPPPVPVFKHHKKYLGDCLKHCNIVHAHNRFVYMPGDARLIKEHGKKLCLTLHNARPQNIDIFTDFFGSLFDDLISKRFMRACDGIAGVSAATLLSTLPNDYSGRTAVIHNGVDQRLFRPTKNTGWKEKLGIDGRMILTNVRLLPQKGLHYLITSMRHVKDAELVVFGRGPLRGELERHGRATGARVHFVTEHISDRELVKLYAASDCFVLSSLYEPCSVALIEAMGCAKPIVATNAGGNEELIQNGKGGIIVERRDVSALAKAINMVLDDRKLAAKFSRFNRKRVEEHFNWDRVAQHVEMFYKSIW